MLIEKPIVVSVDGVPIGAALSVSITTTTNNYKLSCYRVRFDSLRMNTAFSAQIVNPNTQKTPLQIMVLENDEKIIRITNAWITSVNYNYTTPNWIIADNLEMEFETISYIDKTKIKCKYCLEYSVPNHDWIVAELDANISKEKVLSILGVIPHDDNVSNTYRSHAIEIIRGHFPDYYDSMEKLFVLI